MSVSEDKTLSSAGLCARNAPPPSNQRPLGDVVRSRPLRRALRASGDHGARRAPRGCRGRGRRGGFAAGGRPSPCEGRERPALLPRDSTGSRLEWSGRLTVAAAPAAAAIPRTTTSAARSRATLCYLMDCSRQAPLSTGFSKQEYWSGLPFLTNESKSDVGILKRHLTSRRTT